jgi:Uma2 family endonuclease
MENEKQVLGEPAVKYNYVSAEEYLEGERKAVEKHELINGRIVSMAGASLKHNRIVRNLLASVHAKLKGSGCEIFPSDLRVNVPATNSFMYPDLTIVCGKPELLDDQFDNLLNPSVIIEVLSPSTEPHDKGTKFFNYQQIASLKEYILVSSTSALITTITKKDDGLWKFENITDMAAPLTIGATDQQIPLADIYDSVTF